MNDRLQQLKQEFEKGRQQMAALDEKRAELRETLLRISGAIQVLEELLAGEPSASPVRTPPGELPAEPRLAPQ